jgi:hypothetical protein
MNQIHHALVNYIRTTFTYKTQIKCIWFNLFVSVISLKVLYMISKTTAGLPLIEIPIVLLFYEASSMATTILIMIPVIQLSRMKSTFTPMNYMMIFNSISVPVRSLENNIVLLFGLYYLSGTDNFVPCLICFVLNILIMACYLMLCTSFRSN